MEKEKITMEETEKVVERKYNIDKEIRLLNANEIDCRVNTINEKGLTLLLYKDARVDMAILDETYGIGNWQRTHEVINDNLFCNIEVWNDRINQWVKKQDVGVESYSQKEKGQASDSFKRAGFNWGIGRELYTSPFIWIAPRDNKEIFKNNKGALTTYTKFIVKEIGYNKQREINKLIIIDDKGKVRFTTEKKEEAKAPKQTKATSKQIEIITKMAGANLPKILEIEKITLEDLDVKKASEIIQKLNATVEKNKKGEN